MKDSEVRVALTERDRYLIESLSRFLLLSRDQGMALARFNSLTRVNTRLGALVKARLLSRKTLPYYPGQGSAQALYFLTERCAAVLEMESSRLRDHARRIRRWDFRQVNHVLAANQVLIDLILATERTGDFRTEPELRQIFVGRKFVPDGWIAWRLEGKRFNCFVEIDLNHEGLAVWREKVLTYLEYAESGLHQELFGFRFFRVAVLANGQKRLENLRTIASSAGRLMIFADLGSVDSQNILGPIWQGAAEGPVALSSG